MSNQKTNGKRIVLDRKTNVLRIFDESMGFGGAIYTCIFGVTGLIRIGTGWYDIYNKGALLGFVSDVVEVKEQW